jgi:hypothetical protein
MTLRFSLNNYYASIGTVNYYLYDIYRFMTAVSPTGPGWVSIGESNGTTGGMGTTGIITSAASLTAANAWFVLRSPDSKIQILFGKGSATTYYAQSFLTYDQFTGGSGSAIPTYNSSKTIQFLNGYKIYSATANYVHHMVADDAYPYNFYAAAVNISGAPSCSGFASFFNLDGYSSNDGYPYAYMWTTQTGPITSSVDAGSTTYGTKSIHPNGSNWIYSFPCRLYADTSLIIPNAGPPGTIDGSQLIAFPTIFLSTDLYKGVNYSWLKWCSNGTLAQHDTVQNKQWIRLGDFLFKWDGATVPRAI